MQYQKIENFLECHYPIEPCCDFNSLFEIEIDMSNENDDEIENMPASCFGEATKIVAIIRGSSHNDTNDVIFISSSGIGIWHDKMDNVWKTTTKKYENVEIFLSEIKKTLIRMANYN